MGLEEHRSLQAHANHCGHRSLEGHNNLYVHSSLWAIEAFSAKKAFRAIAQEKTFKEVRALRALGPLRLIEPMRAVGYRRGLQGPFKAFAFLSHGKTRKKNKNSEGPNQFSSERPPCLSSGPSLGFLELPQTRLRKALLLLHPPTGLLKAPSRPYAFLDLLALQALY